MVAARLPHPCRPHAACRVRHPRGGAQEQRRGSYTPPAAGTVHAVVAEHGMVVAQEKIAAQIGADVLKRGGNAVDAAVATGFAMAVTYPRAGNIGGGGFMVIHSAEHHEDVAIDYRETAPAATTPGCFSEPDGKPDTAKSRDSALGIGVPGTVAGIWRWRWKNTARANSRWRNCCGRRSSLARDGFVIADDNADTLPDWYRRLARWPSSVKIFSRADGTIAARGRQAGSERSCRDALGDRRTGPARILRGSGRGKAGRRRSAMPAAS